MNRRIWIEIEVKGAALAVGASVYADRRVRPDAWWEETSIRPATSGVELLPLLAEWTRGDYERAMEAVEAELIARYG